MDVAVKLGLIRKNTDGDYFDFFRDRLLFSILPSDAGSETAEADFSSFKILGFSGRALNDEVQPKYLNSPESSIYQKSASLLGAKAARPVVRGTNQVILVEGNFDLLRLHQEGVKNAVAPLGTALTEAQIRLMSRWTDQMPKFVRLRRLLA
ncbi:MAG: toprim domain-containing protein [Deltaproteobacteria bacterium]|nr:toprim domain-containing protein [Deltaproteobacteria bacterium]